jgi:hypothetical protein
MMAIRLAPHRLYLAASTRLNLRLLNLRYAPLQIIASDLSVFSQLWVSACIYYNKIMAA